MLGLKRPKKTEGWAVDVADPENLEQSGFLSRLANNGKLWGLTVALVVLSVGFLCFNSSGDSMDDIPIPSEVRPNVSHDDYEHREFAAAFVEHRSYKPFVVSAEFTAPDVFRIVVVPETTADDIDYIAKMAAERIRYEFDYRSVVNVYVKGYKDGVEELAATARWNTDRRSFVVDFERNDT